MSSATGIELGPESCVLAAVSPRRGGAELTAVHVVEPSAWPMQDVALADRLRAARRAGRFPRSARVVAWGLPDGAKADDPIVRAALRPIVAAGFRIDAVLSPPQALARLAAGRTRGNGEPVAWLALNTTGAAIAIVRNGELLFSRAFEWSFRPHPQAGARSELLQRYSLVTHLAPEVKRGIAMVNASHGLRVDTAVTCGDLPDLRSLTMPLIEELDLEVETLDSVEGLRAGRRVGAEVLAEHAPALRLACVAATAPPQRQHAGPFVRVAATIILLAGAAWGAFTYWTLSHRRVESRPPAATAAVRRPPPTVQAPPPVTKVPTEAAPPAKNTSAPQQAPAAPADTSRGSPPGVPLSRPRIEPLRPERPAPTVRTPRPVPLKEPLPDVDSILVDGNRRLAMIGGAIVQVGDVVGPRTVTQIERDYVIFREPSGLIVRVNLRRDSPNLVLQVPDTGRLTILLQSGIAAELGRPYNFRLGSRRNSVREPRCARRSASA